LDNPAIISGYNVGIPFLFGHRFCANLQVLILIYASHISSPRLQYVLHELFSRRLGIDWRLTGRQEDLDRHQGARINYSHEDLPHCLHIKPHSLLAESTISNHSVLVKYDKEWDSIFFEQPTDIPFDLFAASFYLLSRYEEYLPHKVDEHGRFHHEQSLAVQQGFIETPLVDKWILNLKSHLERQFGKMDFSLPAFQCISTVDIDVAYLYKGISPDRQLLKIGKSSMLFRFGKAAAQMKVHLGKMRDPYDTYDYIHQVTRNVTLKYFILSGGNTEYDQPLAIDGNVMQTLLLSLSARKELGLHPSYASSDQEGLIVNEKKQLEAVLEKKVTFSRQHFLRFRLPHTMNTLLKQGIEQEYSMAYSGIAGFRASTCHPFCFFDLEQNKASTLVLYPTCVMDVTLRYNMGMSVHAAIAKVEQLMNEVKQVNGIFISIWHNSNLSETDEWLPWKEVFEKIHTLVNRK
jgi:hypothetical protein